MALCVAKKRQIRCNYEKFILENLIEANLKSSSKNKLYMSAGPMLTRITYQALGMIEDLLVAGSQASLIQHAIFVPKGVKTTTTATSSRTRRSSKKSLSDEERINTDKEQDSYGSDKKEDNQKGAEAKGPLEHEPSDEEDTSTLLDRKSKRPRTTEQILLDEAMAKVEARNKELADASAAKAAKSTKPMTMEEAKKIRMDKAKAIQEERRSLEVEQKAQEEAVATQSAQATKEKEVVDLTSTIEHLKKRAAHEAKVKELEQELAQAKAELEIQKQKNEELSKEKQAVGSLTPTTQINQAETLLHVHLPHMPKMHDLPSTSHHNEEQQGLTPGVLDVKGDIEQNIEDMPQGPAKEFLLHEKRVMESATLAYLQPDEQVKGLYEQSMEDNGIQNREAIDGFHLIVVPKLKTQITELQTQLGTDWPEFKKALKEEYFLEDSQRVMKQSFMKWINQKNKGLSARELLREFEKKYEQLSSTEQRSIRFERVELFVQAADAWLQKSLVQLLEDAIGDLGLTQLEISI
ncbi:hypothetical protein L7F22_049535 [Adiantum nelumboides]|nr:hypothetical protein [Adiantum nelumboides]